MIDAAFVSAATPGRTDFATELVHDVDELVRPLATCGVVDEPTEVRPVPVSGVAAEPGIDREVSRRKVMGLWAGTSQRGREDRVRNGLDRLHILGSDEAVNAGPHCEVVRLCTDSYHKMEGLPAMI
jgi:hypothetical protein